MSETPKERERRIAAENVALLRKHRDMKMQQGALMTPEEHEHKIEAEYMMARMLNSPEPIIIPPGSILYVKLHQGNEPAAITGGKTIDLGYKSEMTIKNAGGKVIGHFRGEVVSGWWISDPYEVTQQ